MNWGEIATQLVILIVLPAIGFVLTRLIHVAFQVLERQKYIKDSEVIKAKLEAVRALLSSDVLKAWEELSKGIRQDAADGKITKAEMSARLAQVGAQILEEFKEDWPEYVDALGLGRIKKEMEAIYAQFKSQMLGE